MNNKQNADTIIKGYKQANEDANEVLMYLETIDDPSQMDDIKLPSIVKNLENTESSVTKAYIGTASIVGGTVAATIATSISSSAFTGVLGMTALGGAGIAGMAAPFLGWFALPIIAVPVYVKLLNDVKIKKYINSNKETMKKNKVKMEKEKKRLLEWLAELQERGEKIDNKITDRIKEKFTEFKNKTKNMAKDIAIQIDDCLNFDTNKRILQYNEVILNQYRLQKELEEKVDFLFVEYNKLLDEKKEIERQVNCLIKLLNAMGCPEAVINQALS